MKKILPIVIIAILVLSGLGASALQSDDIKPDSKITVYQDPSTSSSPKDYTHTVLVEVGTATWCPSCPASNEAWHTIYASGNYNFEYTELVYDKNPVASSRFYEFNPMWVPTSYWDGGEFVFPGTNIATFYNNLDSSGSRAVPDLVADLNATWLGSAQIEISYNIVNNEASNYPGHLRIYVIELNSTLWNDYSGKAYHHAFLDFAVNQVIDIPAADSISDTIVWDGTAAGFPGITQDNIQVILAVFGNTPHQSYSDPPTGNPFWAYYSDECTAVTFGETVNNPPTTPTIDGPTSGTPGTAYTYTFSSTDPEGDDVYYCVNWSDGTGEVCIGPFPSGEEVTATHTWLEQGTYVITVKAHDIYDAESDPGTLEVTITQESSIQITINGGLGVSATIKNNGTTDITNMNWSITLDGKLIFLGKSKSGTINALAVGESVTVKDFVFGFGKTGIAVEAGGFGASASGRALLFFVIGVA
jgi:thiol-disulfide isomerase/thioredoxin